MKDMDCVKRLRQKIQVARPSLERRGNPIEAVQRTLEIVLDYIEFMVTLCEDDDEDREASEKQWEESTKT